VSSQPPKDGTPCHWIRAYRNHPNPPGAQSRAIHIQQQTSSVSTNAISRQCNSTNRTAAPILCWGHSEYWPVRKPVIVVYLRAEARVDLTAWCFGV
jgi:hypothetical protein